MSIEPWRTNLPFEDSKHFEWNAHIYQKINTLKSAKQIEQTSVSSKINSNQLRASLSDRNELDGPASAKCLANNEICNLEQREKKK